MLPIIIIIDAGGHKSTSGRLLLLQRFSSVRKNIRIVYERPRSLPQSNLKPKILQPNVQLLQWYALNNPPLPLRQHHQLYQLIPWSQIQHHQVVICTPAALESTRFCGGFHPVCIEYVHHYDHHLRLRLRGQPHLLWHPQNYHRHSTSCRYACGEA